MIPINNSYIKNITHLGQSNYIDGMMHIALTFDNNYAMPAGITIFSIIKNNPNSSIHFHLIVDSISKENITKFKQLIQSNVCISLYQINTDFKINEKTLNERFPPISCARFIIPQLLDSITSKVLYIDSDTICLGSLINLYNINLEKKIIAAVIDSFEELHIYAKNTLNIENNYFNSGVLLINIPEWIQNDLTEKCIDMVNNGFLYKYADQDVLNILLNGHVDFLPSKYNNEIILLVDSNNEETMPQDTLIVHYVSPNKPWYKVYNSKIFSKYFSDSPWKKNPLPLTNKSSSLRKYYKLCLKKGRIFKAIYYYCTYIKLKIF